MPLLILAVLIALPLMEVGLFIEVGGAIGLWPTLGLAVLSAVVGIWLVRLQGFAVLAQVRSQLAQGQVPARELFDAVCLALAGMLLLLPGFATDALGVLLLLPPVRGWLFTRSRRRAERAGVRTRVYRDGQEVYRSGPDGRGGYTIDGEWAEVDSAETREGEARGTPANDEGRDPPKLDDHRS